MSLAIHQLVHTLSYGDAISGEVIALRDCFREFGIESHVYAINVHPLLEGQAIKYDQYQFQEGDQIILHYSLGSPLNDFYRENSQAKRILLYHNLTPYEWFSGVNPRIVKDIQRGLVELPELCAVSDLLIADSAFNAGELEKLGFAATVLPLPLDSKKWNIDKNPGIADLLSNSGMTNLLHVGRIAPNKCIEDIIKTFYFYHHKINYDSVLWLPGIDIDTELYSFALKRLVEELDLVDSVRFPGCMADSELKSLYLHSDVYLCMSEHEGFCLPLVEAMFFGLPVIAYASSAIPETLSTGGILVSEKRHHEIAELVDVILTDSELKNRLIGSGQERVKNMSLENFKDNVRAVFLDAVEPATKMCVNTRN